MWGNMLASDAPRGDLGFGSSRPLSDLLHTLLRHEDEVEISLFGVDPSTDLAKSDRPTSHAWGTSKSKTRRDKLEVD
jgi:hypothetical protein